MKDTMLLTGVEARLLREAVDISIQYFNSGAKGSRKLTQLTKRSKDWCKRYFARYTEYGSRRATELIKEYPNLFNLKVERKLPEPPAA